jgi:predicted  nucleic acid-binding Zn-ribbon protein
LSRQYKQAIADLNDKESYTINKLGDGLKPLKDNYSSASTITSTQNRKMTLENDKLKNELEESLVYHKLKYAEETSKRMDLEDRLSLLTNEYKKSERNLSSVNEALKYKDDIIDQLIKQKEELSRKCRSKKNNYSVVINNIGEIENKSMINDRSFCSEADNYSKSPISVRLKQESIAANTSRVNQLENTSPVKEGKKGFGGFMKNLFK